MLTMHPTLLIGGYDWDSARLPEEEFRERIEAFWAQIPDSACSAAIVYGDSRNHAELAYLSHFTPKLGPALLLMPRQGEPTLLVSGAPNMLPAARRMTWIESTRPLSDPVPAVEQWLKEHGVAPSSNAFVHSIALIGGDSMKAAFRRLLDNAFARESSFAEATSALKTLMCGKRPRELSLIHEACAILNAATESLRHAQSSGAGVTAAILDAEQAAYGAGAQDVRTLFSLNGGRTLRPFETQINSVVDPLQVYMAIRHSGYWVEGFALFAAVSQPALEKAAGALAAVIDSARGGTRCSDLSALAAEAIRPYGEHPMSDAMFSDSIGLFLHEQLTAVGDGEPRLETDHVYTVRVGASDGLSANAMVSAMIHVHDNASEVLWSAKPLT
jgi:hypothetical protein